MGTWRQSEDETWDIFLRGFFSLSPRRLCGLAASPGITLALSSLHAGKYWHKIKWVYKHLFLHNVAEIIMVYYRENSYTSPQVHVFIYWLICATNLKSNALTDANIIMLSCRRVTFISRYSVQARAVRGNEAELSNAWYYVHTLQHGTLHC